jgi:hypothetical protein
MSPRFEDELPRSLAERVRAVEADAAGDDAVAAAQQRLRERLQHKRKPSRAPARGWWAVAATMVIALAVSIVLPMLPGNGEAFAAVQARFRHFETLSMTVTQRFRGEPLQTSHILVDARGVVRTDVGEQLSVIVDAPRGRLLTLLHEPREAMIAGIPKTKAAQDDALPWLDDLRDFKGQATPLPGTRLIDGRTARGWTLELQGMTMTLWADADGLPLAMRQHGGAGLEIDYRFEFDRPIPPGRLSSDVPAGYTPVAADGD